MNLLVTVIAAAVFGAIIGSFLNVVIWRLPRGQSLGGRSKCPHCGSVLQPSQLVPVFSYVWQGRRCANCRQAISPRYLVVECVTGLLFAAASWYILAGGFDAFSWFELLRLLFIISILIAVFVIDLEHYLILDGIIFPAALVVLVLNITLDFVSHQSILSWASHTGGGVVAALLAGGFFYLLWRISQGRWMGFGDVKLNLLLGLALGLPGIAVGLFLAFMAGSFIGIGLIIAGTKKLKSRLPFGTFLSFGALLALFYGPALAAWYARLIGWR